MTRAARLDTSAMTLAIRRGPGAQVHVAYFGARLPDTEDLGAVADAAGPHRRGSAPDIGVDAGLFSPEFVGFAGAPSIELGGVCPAFEFQDLASTDKCIEVQLFEPGRGLSLSLKIAVAGEMFEASARLENQGNAAVEVGWLASLCLPLPDWARFDHGGDGFWSGEHQGQPREIICGRIERESREGRPGFAGAGFALVGDGWVANSRGRIIGAALAWSGNQRLLMERLSTGEAQMQLGVRLAPGEGRLEPGQALQAPGVVFAYSGAGLNGLREAFHGHARRVSPSRGPRKVHLNSWEALYFDVNAARVIELIEAAAGLGVERFVLDDGWFVGRTSDGAGLGDWQVDRVRFPNGLGPLIAAAKQRGMDFGIWVEPEMTNPDSALYAAHPNWVLHRPDAARPLQRKQLVLDLTRPDVFAFVWGALDALLTEHEIAYLKWDHNRALFPAESGGVACARAQAQAHLDLLDRLRAAHPQVEIESCASGGGRVDYAVLSRVDRFWISDHTDPVERLRMLAGASTFLPLRMIGAHVGASPNPISGRSTPMLLRARVAMFGHMGVEADPARMSEAERIILRDHIALYKDKRALLHEGRLVVLDCEDPGVSAIMVVSRDQSSALALLARVDSSKSALSGCVRIDHLDPDKRYTVTVHEPWPTPARHWMGGAADWKRGLALSGAALAQAGLRLPLVHPYTSWLVSLEAQDAV